MSDADYAADDWWTLDELNRREPDEHHFQSTVDSFVSMTSNHRYARVWRAESVEVSAIDRSQVADDPDDDLGEAKIESIRGSIRQGIILPHVVVLHDPERDSTYFLIEGRHRYNAHLREGEVRIGAFVAHHDGCCGAPE